MAILTDRWEVLRFHAVQQAYWNSMHRFNVVPAGRRSGKTELGKRKLVRRAIKGTRFDRPRFFAGAPTRDQAKRIYWDDLKAMVPEPFRYGDPSESELTIRLITGAEIVVVGLDKPERIEGTPWDGGLLDEYANMKPQTWTEHVRPALSDRMGWCDFLGVPEGRNHYYDLDKAAIASMTQYGPTSLWGHFHWISADILPAEEIEAARADLDELTYAQEYEASFVNFHGRAYYNFTEETHCAALRYDPERELVLCFDFNVSPGTASVVQEQLLPNKTTGTGVIDEVWIPRNSNTERVCDVLIERYKGHKGPVVCYGDATGGSGGSAKVQGSDWDLINGKLRPVFGARLSFDVPRENPRQRPRINAVNARLKSQDGTVRLMVDPTKAPHMVKDFEGVRLVEGGAGEIDKSADLMLTHLTDGVGYYVARRYPVVSQSVVKREMF